MKTVVAAVALLVGLSPVVLAEPPAKERGKELAALERKLLGAWEGKTGCDGHFVFREDGTYTLKGFGPAAHDSAGTWKVRWDALPPTLVMTCKDSGIPEEVGTVREVKLIKLDDNGLAIKYANPNGSPPGHYKRVKLRACDPGSQ